MPKEKKVLFLINSLKFGGAERMFVKTMNAFLESGVDVYLALLLGNEQDEGFSNLLTVNKSNIFYVRANNFYDFAGLIRLKRFVEETGITSVYSTLDESNISSRLLKVLNPKIEVVIREANVAGPKPLKFKILDCALNFFARSIVCVSEEVKASLIRYQPFFESKMQVLPNGIDVPEQSKRHEDKSGSVVIINVGSFTSKKGQKFLIEAVSRVEKNKPNSCRLVLVGGGVEEKSLRELVKENHIEEKVEFRGKLSPDKVSEAYLSADVFVLSSLWEGSPNVLLEAMAQGLVCISTEVSGARGMIEEGISGFLVPKGDTVALAERIEEVLDKKESFSKLGAAARKRIVDQFSFPVYTKRLKSILGLI